MRLSIITINYNNKQGLQKTIDSVISQTFKDFEWIVIDGGSTDGSRELIEKYQEYFAFWCSEPDKGIYNAMNKGIRKASGEYCLFLNSGDYLYGDCLHLIIYRFKEDIVIGRVKMACSGALSYQYSNKTFSISQLYLYSFPHQASFIKRRLFEKYGYYDEAYKIVSDWGFFLRVLKEVDVNVEFITNVVSIVDEDGISSVNKNLLKKEREKMISETFPLWLIQDIKYSSSLHDIFRNKIAKTIYSVLYRLFA